MTGPEPTEEEAAAPEAAPQETPAQRARRRRRLAEVFGEVLPDQTADDADETRSRSGADEDWLRRQVPPHHG